MATLAPNENETWTDFLVRARMTEDEFYNLNPNFDPVSWIAGAQFNVPDMVTPPAGAEGPTAPVVPGGVAGTEAPTGLLAGGGAEGLFNEMLKDFRKAFQTFLSAPGFIKEPKGTTSPRVHPTAGWSGQEAEFLRSNEETYATRYEEQVQRQFAETGELPTLSPAEFLRTINPRTEMEMRSNETRTGRPRVPSTGIRRLRF